MKRIIISFLLSLTVVILFSQKQDSLKYKVYKINPFIDIPVTAVAAVTNTLGLRLVDKKPILDSITIANLDPHNINRFDRSVTNQDADFALTAQRISDFGMYGSYALPLLLLVDQDIRKDWAELLLLYIETEAIVGNLFSWGAAIHIDRIRPLVYHPDIPYADKTYKRNKNSFYSGHTSSSAAASFFVAKVYCDYHPELGKRKYIVYSIALIPPAFTGLFRIKGMKHFRTDVLTGLAVGAGTGILIPHLHKQKNANLAIIPFTGKYNGIALSLKF